MKRKSYFRKIILKMKNMINLKNFFLILCLLAIVTPSIAKRQKKVKKKKAKTSVVMKDTTFTQLAPTPPSATISFNSQEEKIVLSQLVVSFVSRGYGVDMKAVDDFFYLMNQFNEKNHLTLMFDHKVWGREGERDYCFVGNNQLLIGQFSNELKKHFANNKLVFVKENTPCKK